MSPAGAIDACGDRKLVPARVGCPVRKRPHLAAWNVPVDVAGRGLQQGFATLV